MDPAEVATLSTLLETTYMSGIDGLVSVLQEIRATWGPIDLSYFKEDWESGFRTLNLKPDHQRFFIAAAENEHGEIVCFVPTRLLFGPSRCPPQFSRVSKASERVQTEFLWIVTNHHVDDHIAFETVELMESARLSVRRLAAILQIPLADKKALPAWCKVCAHAQRDTVPHLHRLWRLPSVQKGQYCGCVPFFTIVWSEIRASAWPNPRTPYPTTAR